MQKTGIRPAAIISKCHHLIINMFIIKVSIGNIFQHLVHSKIFSNFIELF